MEDFPPFNNCCLNDNISRMSNIESNNSKNGGLEDYNNISDGIFPYFTRYNVGLKEFTNSFKYLMFL